MKQRLGPKTGQWLLSRFMAIKNTKFLTRTSGTIHSRGIAHYC